MQSYQTLYIDKQAIAFDTTLIAGGLAKLIYDMYLLAGNPEGDVEIHDLGHCYQLELTEAIDDELIAQVSPMLMPVAPILTKKNEESLAGFTGQTLIDYEAEKEKRALYFQEREHNPNVDRPSKHWDIYRAINPSALIGYNNLIDSWRIVRDKPDTLKLLFDVLSQTPNDIVDAIDAWKGLTKEQEWKIDPESTCLQLYNPDQGKGQNHSQLKLSIGNVKSFWMLEWLKAIGFYEMAMTRSPLNTKDQKTYVIAPAEIDFKAHRSIMEEFMGTMLASESSVRMDIRVTLRYAKALLLHYFPTLQKDDDFGFAQWLPRKTIRGIYSAYYKDLGNSSATMNISFIALPEWVQVHKPDDVMIYIHTEDGLLSVLDDFLRQFDEKHSDELTLLEDFRDFICGGKVSGFFSFARGFSAYYVQQRERGKYATQLTTYTIERLFMNDSKLSGILQDEGFRNVAYAIRQATVIAQYRKKQGNNKYEVRYGLGQELARKSRYAADFIVILSDFLHKYNAETARANEVKDYPPYRRSIQTSDIDAVARLIDTHGAETVASMLIAYGYARETREDDNNE